MYKLDGAAACLAQDSALGARHDHVVMLYLIRRDNEKTVVSECFLPSSESSIKSNVHKTLVNSTYSPFDAVGLGFAFVFESSRQWFATWGCILAVDRPRTGFNGDQCPEKVVFRITVRPGDNAVCFVVVVHDDDSFPCRESITPGRQAVKEK
jgi:hypothetical protein